MSYKYNSFYNSDGGSFDNSWSTDESNDSIESACKLMRSAYSPGGLDRGKASENLDFSDNVYRQAYIGRYLGSHLSVVQSKLDAFWCLSPLVQNWLYELEEEDNIYVCSIGGGPGTDILGLNLFLQDRAMPHHIQGTIFDYYNWERNFKQLARKLDPCGCGICHGIHSVRYDFFSEPLLKNMRRKLQFADLVTMVKFVSSVGHDRQTCVEKIEEIVGYMKPGAMLFFADNSGGGYFELVEEAIDECEVQLAVKAIHQFTEASPDIIDRFDLNRNCCYNCSPQVGTKISAAMWLKL